MLLSLSPLTIEHTVQNKLEVSIRKFQFSQSTFWQLSEWREETIAIIFRQQSKYRLRELELWISWEHSTILLQFLDIYKRGLFAWKVWQDLFYCKKHKVLINNKMVFALLYNIYCWMSVYWMQEETPCKLSVDFGC